MLINLLLRNYLHYKLYDQVRQYGAFIADVIGIILCGYAVTSDKI